MEIEKSHLTTHAIILSCGEEMGFREWLVDRLI